MLMPRQAGVFFFLCAYLGSDEVMVSVVLHFGRTIFLASRLLLPVNFMLQNKSATTRQHTKAHFSTSINLALSSCKMFRARGHA